MLDVRHMFEKCDVQYRAEWYDMPVGKHEKGTNYLIIQPDPQDPKCTGTVGIVWAHVTQVWNEPATTPRKLRAHNFVNMLSHLFVSMLASAWGS